jgi:Icc-related predicted phosphoesterase
MFTISSICRKPLLKIPSLEGARGGGIWHRQLELYLGFARLDGFPAEALLCLSDLQGRCPFFSSGRIAAHRIPAMEIIERCRHHEKSLLPPAGDTVILICGDMFASGNLLRRGQSGCAVETWNWCSTQARLVIGVAGNHDRFDSGQGFPGGENVHFLEHGSSVYAGEILIAGCGGMIGNPAKPFRYTETVFIEDIRTALQRQPDIMLMHQGPDLPGALFAGNTSINRELEAYDKALTLIYGHIGSSRLFQRIGHVDCINIESTSAFTAA